jgi:hypothetical protein
LENDRKPPELIQEEGIIAANIYSLFGILSNYEPK